MSRILNLRVRRENYVANEKVLRERYANRLTQLDGQPAVIKPECFGDQSIVVIYSPYCKETPNAKGAAAVVYKSWHEVDQHVRSNGLLRDGQAFGVKTTLALAPVS